MNFAEIVTASYEKEAYFHRNYKARCILDFHNKKDAKGLVNKYRGGGGGGPEHFEMWWLENT